MTKVSSTVNSVPVQIVLVGAALVTSSTPFYLFPSSLLMVVSAIARGIYSAIRRKRVKKT